VENRQGRLRAGSFATAEVLIDSQQPVVFAPASAVITFAGIEKVLGEKQGRIVERRIRIGRRAGDRVEVLEGAAPGDLIVAEPGNLSGGEPVIVKHRIFVQKLAEICIRRPIFATMLILALCVVGGASYVSLGVDRFPSVDLPTVSIRTELPGASTEEVETEISKRIEEAVNTIQGIDELRSISGPELLLSL